MTLCPEERESLMQLPAVFFAKLILRQEDIVGKGTCHDQKIDRETRVYAPPQFPSVVFRVQAGLEEICEDLAQKPECFLKEDHWPINVGQRIGRFGKHIHILRKQKGVPVFSLGTSKNHPERLPALMEEYVQRIKKMADLPTESYVQILKDAKLAEEKEHFFDILSCENLFFDQETDSLGLIDLAPAKYNLKPDGSLPMQLACMMVYTTDQVQVTEAQKEKLSDGLRQVLEKLAFAASQEKIEREDATFTQSILEHKLSHYFAEEERKRLLALFSTSEFSLLAIKEEDRLRDLEYESMITKSK